MIALMVMVLIMFMLTTVRAFQNLPVVGRYKPMVVLSGSMEPGIKVGSVVLVAAVNPDDIKVDDIITFPLPRKPDNQEPANTTHRVTRVIADSGGLRFITKGDANDTVDNWEVAAAGAGHPDLRDQEYRVRVTAE
ncbi:signal peptidase I W [bacterium BMS3Abin01]|nr:signal peptidase I W [bacterium BMS3Abin01]